MAQGPPRRTPSDSDAKPNRNGANVGFEAKLWQWPTSCATTWTRPSTSTSSSA